MCLGTKTNGAKDRFKGHGQDCVVKNWAGAILSLYNLPLMSKSFKYNEKGHF